MLPRLSQLSRVLGRRILPAARFKSHAADDEAQMDLSTLMDMDPDQSTPLDLNDRKSFLLSTVFATTPPELPVPAKGVKAENAVAQALRRMDSAASDAEARREHRMIQAHLIRHTFDPIHQSLQAYNSLRRRHAANNTDLRAVLLCYRSNPKQRDPQLAEQCLADFFAQAPAIAGGLGRSDSGLDLSDVHLYRDVLRVLLRAQLWKRISEVVPAFESNSLRQTGVPSTSFATTMLMRAYAELNDVEHGVALYTAALASPVNAPTRNTAFFDARLALASSQGDLASAMRVFSDMIQFECIPTRLSFTFLLRLCTGNLKAALQIVARMTDYNVKPSVRTTESLMQLAAEQNDLPVAVRLWQASTSLPAWKLPQDWSQKVIDSWSENNGSHPNSLLLDLESQQALQQIEARADVFALPFRPSMRTTLNFLQILTSHCGRSDLSDPTASGASPASPNQFNERALCYLLAQLRLDRGLVLPRATQRAVADYVSRSAPTVDHARRALIVWQRVLACVRSDSHRASEQCCTDRFQHIWKDPAVCANESAMEREVANTKNGSNGSNGSTALEPLEIAVLYEPLLRRALNDVMGESSAHQSVTSAAHAAVAAVRIAEWVWRRMHRDVASRVVDAAPPASVRLLLQVFVRAGRLDRLLQLWSEAADALQRQPPSSDAVFTGSSEAAAFWSSAWCDDLLQAACLRQEHLPAALKFYRLLRVLGIGCSSKSYLTLLQTCAQRADALGDLDLQLDLLTDMMDPRQPTLSINHSAAWSSAAVDSTPAEVQLSHVQVVLRTLHNHAQGSPLSAPLNRLLIAACCAPSAAPEPGTTPPRSIKFENLSPLVQALHRCGSSALAAAAAPFVQDLIALAPENQQAALRTSLQDILCAERVRAFDVEPWPANLPTLDTSSSVSVPVLLHCARESSRVLSFQRTQQWRLRRADEVNALGSAGAGVSAETSSTLLWSQYFVATHALFPCLFVDCAPRPAASGLPANWPFCAAGSFTEKPVPVATFPNNAKRLMQLAQLACSKPGSAFWSFDMLETVVGGLLMQQQGVAALRAVQLLIDTDARAAQSGLASLFSSDEALQRLLQLCVSAFRRSPASLFPAAAQHLLDDVPNASGAEFALRDAQRAAAAETAGRLLCAAIARSMAPTSANFAWVLRALAAHPDKELTSRHLECWLREARRCGHVPSVAWFDRLVDVERHSAVLNRHISVRGVREVTVEILPPATALSSGDTYVADWAPDALKARSKASQIKL